MDKKKPVLSTNFESIKGLYHPLKDWIMDPNGYFLIRVDKQKKVIELGHCKRNNEIEVLITGKKPQDLYFAAFERGLVSRFDHAAYLGKELEKAFLALKYDLEYVQDDELEIKP